MTDPTVRSVGTELDGSGTSLAFAVPAGVAADDIIIVSALTNGATTLSGLPTGFAHADGSPVASGTGGGIQHLNVCWKRATGSDTGTYAFTQSASDFHEGRAIAYKDCVTTGSPFDTGTGAPTSAGSTTGTTSSPSLSITTTTDGALAVHFASTAGGEQNWTPSTGFTEDAGNTTDKTCAAFHKDIPTAGAVSSVVATNSGSGQMAAWLGALLPVGGGTTTVTGTAAGALGGMAGTATGIRRVLGTASAALGGAAAAATGRLTSFGTAAAALGGMLGSALGPVTVTGTAAAAFGSLVGTMRSRLTVTGTASGALGGLTAQASSSPIVYTFTPPLNTRTSRIRGSLFWSYPVAEKVWRDTAGVWHHEETPPDEELAAASVVIMVPQVVSRDIAIELIEAGIGTVSPTIVIPPPPIITITGTAAASLGGATAAAAGIPVSAAPVIGTAAGSFGALTGTATGAPVTPTVVTGTAAGAFGALAGSASGGVRLRLGATFANGNVTTGQSTLNATNGYARVYSGAGAGLISWASTYMTQTLTALGSDGIMHYSFKDDPTTLDLATWFDSIPTGRVIWVTYHHEDEQGTGGDISLSAYQAGWAALRTARDAHAKAAQIILVGVVTEYRCAFSGEDWQDWWTGHEDKMAADCYNLTPSGNDYRLASDIWATAASIASVTGQPAAVPEYGCDPKTGDTDGSGRIACVQAQIQYLYDHPGIVEAVSWFSEGTNGTLHNTPALETAWHNLCNAQ